LKTLISAGFPMPNQPESALERLDAALCHVADCLARLPPEEFDRLARAEAADLPLVFQFFEATGWPTMFPPERWLGHRILEFYAQRYPALAQDAAGTA
jgi:hypothetical protein